VVNISHLCASKGTLADGCKVAVFSSRFESDLNGAIIHLQINCVRKASNSAKLGFINKRFLHRGLAVSGLIKEGGSIFAIKVDALFVSPVLTRIRFEAPSNTKDFIARWMTLDIKEFAVLQDLVDKQKSKVYERLECHEDLSLGAVLDYLGCDDSIVSIILVCSIHYYSTAKVSVLRRFF
jgi:hypothetical protein